MVAATFLNLDLLKTGAAIFAIFFNVDSLAFASDFRTVSSTFNKRGAATDTFSLREKPRLDWGDEIFKHDY